MIDIDFFEELEGDLGGNLVDVELTEDDYVRAFNKAKRTYIQKGNDNFRRTFYELPVIAGTTVYAMPPTTNEIIKIIKPSGFTTDNPFTQAIVNDMFAGVRGSNNADLATYELSSQMIENIDIYTANATPFNFDRIAKNITLLDTPNITEKWMLETYESLTDNEYRDVLWVHEWALAELKIVLGRAYSKFGSLSSPTGETSVGGDLLLSEGREDKDRLLEEIKGLTDGAPTGLPIIIG